MEVIDLTQEQDDVDEGPPCHTQSLPVCLNQLDRSPTGQATCPICLQDILDPVIHARALPCLHTYCSPCLNAWAARKRICALCRGPLEGYIYDVKSSTSFQQYTFPPLPEEQAQGQAAPSSHAEAGPSSRHWSASTSLSAVADSLNRELWLIRQALYQLDSRHAALSEELREALRPLPGTRAILGSASIDNSSPEQSPERPERPESRTAGLGRFWNGAVRPDSAHADNNAGRQSANQPRNSAARDGRAALRNATGSAGGRSGGSLDGGSASNTRQPSPYYLRLQRGVLSGVAMRVMQQQEQQLHASIPSGQATEGQHLVGSSRLAVSSQLPHVSDMSRQAARSPAAPSPRATEAGMLPPSQQPASRLAHSTRPSRWGVPLPTASPTDSLIWRRSVYANNLWARPMPSSDSPRPGSGSGSGSPASTSGQTPGRGSSDSGSNNSNVVRSATHHKYLSSWLDRELRALLLEEDVGIVAAYVQGLIRSYGFSNENTSNGTQQPPTGGQRHETVNVPTSRLANTSRPSTGSPACSGRSNVHADVTQGSGSSSRTQVTAATASEENAMASTTGSAVESSLRPFLGDHASHFWHEMRCFATSGLSLQAYDMAVQYQTGAPSVLNGSARLPMTTARHLQLSSHSESTGNLPALHGMRQEGGRGIAVTGRSRPAGRGWDALPAGVVHQQQQQQVQEPPQSPQTLLRPHSNDLGPSNDEIAGTSHLQQPQEVQSNHAVRQGLSREPVHRQGLSNTAAADTIGTQQAANPAVDDIQQERHSHDVQDESRPHRGRHSKGSHSGRKRTSARSRHRSRSRSLERPSRQRRHVSTSQADSYDRTRVSEKGAVPHRSSRSEPYRVREVDYGQYGTRRVVLNDRKDEEHDERDVRDWNGDAQIVQYGYEQDDPDMDDRWQMVG